MRVAERHRNRLVAHNLLKGSQVDACHSETARERVLQVVPSEIVDTCILLEANAAPAGGLEGAGGASGAGGICGGGRVFSHSPFKNLIWIPASAGIASLNSQTRDLGGILGIELKNNLRIHHYRRVKRIFDLAVALPALLASLPIFALYALFIGLADPGPVFFTQPRVGFGGRKFRVLKLRTMYQNAAQRLGTLLERDPQARAHWETHFKLRRDPRVLPFLGSLVRRFSLDELPQFWNVFRNEMSVVGPRPFPLYHLSSFPDSFRSLRRTVRPGLTGFWQVSARSDADLETQESLDTYYIRNWSLWLDLYIVFRTAGTVVTGRGAY